MIFKMLKNSFVVLIVFLLLSFVYIISSQKSKISAYEYGGDNNVINDALVIENNIGMDKKIGDSNIDSFISCYEEPIEKEDFTDEMNKKLNEINKHFASSPTKVSFSYEDLFTGLHLSYNENSTYFAASVIKSPVVLYVYKMYLNNELSLDEVLTYQSSHYVAGTGSIQYQKFGTKYTIRELIAKTIIESDNIAYTMLCQRVNNSNIRNFWKEKGVTTFWYGNNIWGRVNSRDGAIYMKELYFFLNEHPELKEEILSYYYKSATRLINLNNNTIPIAHKSGWTSAAIHDMAIVYSEQPYVLSINSLMGYNNFTSFFYKASNLINEFHKLYWDKKSERCYKKVFE